jgi:hypothetical protein
LVKDSPFFDGLCAVFLCFLYTISTGVDGMKTKLGFGAKKAKTQKESLLNSKTGYFIISNNTTRKILPELVQKYDGRTARDAFTLYCFLLSYVNGDPKKEEYGWAYPSFDQITEGTGIHRSRIKALVKILSSEGLLLTADIPYNGRKKNFYCPLYRQK